MNSHHETAQGLIQQDREWTVGWETADAQHLAIHIEAQAEATLSLAYEQRTAAMVALLNAGFTSVKVAGVNYTELADQIKERLGL